MRGNLLRPLLVGVILAAAALPTGATAAPTWLAPTSLSAYEPGAERPAVAVDAAGDAVAVWSQYPRVEAAERPAGGSWGAPVPLSSATATGSGVEVATDPKGDVVAVWGENESNGDLVIQAASRPAGGSWSGPTTISSPPEEAEIPEVALDSAGEAVVTWASWDGFRWIFQAATKPPGGIWQELTNLTEEGTAGPLNDVAVDAAGDAVAVWTRASGGITVIRSATRPAGGAWQPAVTLSDESESAEEPRVAMNAAGAAAVTWSRSDGTHSRIQVMSRTPTGPWTLPETISTAGGDASSSNVAVDPAGGAVAVWSYNGEEAVQAASGQTGGTLEGPMDLSAPGELAGEPTVVADPTGEAVAAWSATDGPTPVVQAARRAGGTWSQPQVVSPPGGHGADPALGVDGFGDVVAAWSRFDGTYWVDQIAGEDVAGPQLRGLSIPAEGTVGVPLTFAVAPFDVWSGLGGTSWSFGDGASAASTEVSHVYSAPGTYKVTVTGADALGNATTTSAVVSIAPAPAVAPAGATTTVATAATATAKARVGRIVKVEGGTALLELHCGKTAECAGTVRISVPVAAKGGAKKAAGTSAGRRARRLPIAQTSFRLAAGGERTLKVGLSRQGGALLRARDGRAGLEAQLDGSGVVGRPVTLKAVGHRHRR